MNEQTGAPQDQRFFSPEGRSRFYKVGLALLLSAIALHFLIGFQLEKALPKDRGAEVWFEYADGEAAAWWRDTLWFPAIRTEGFFQFFSPNAAERRLVKMTPKGPVGVCGLGSGRTWLMPREDGLWIFSPDGVSRYTEEGIQRIEAQKPPESDGPPVLWEGKPAFATMSEGTVTLRVLEEKQWKESANFTITPDPTTPLDELRMVVSGGQPLFLLRSGKALFAHEGTPAGASRFPTDWRKIGETDGVWAADASGERATVFTFRLDAANPAGAIRLHAQGAAGWSDSEIQRLFAPPISLGAMADGKVRLFAQSVPWTVNLMTLEDGRVATSERAGRFYSLADEETIVLLVGVATSLMLTAMLVVAFWALMLGHRQPYYTLMGPPARLASLARRASALAVDALILFAPLGVALLLWREALSRAESTAAGVSAALTAMAVLGALGWAGVGTLIFTFTQGHYGRTPGKWLLGIRVLSLELRPCGFGRSLLRNLFLLPDSLMDFTVGIALIAYSRHWQRLGDLFARTIVVRDVPQPTDLAYIQSGMRAS